MSSLKDYAEYDDIDGLEMPGKTDTSRPGQSMTRTLDGSGFDNVNPEDLSIPLPSSFGWDWCTKHGAKSLAIKEAKLRYAQANDAIHKIRLALGFKSALFRTQVRPAKTQRMKTRAWKTVHGVDTTVQEHACVYSMARDAFRTLRKGLQNMPELPKLKAQDLHIATHILGSAQSGQRNKQPSWIWSFGETIADHGTWMDGCK